MCTCITWLYFQFEDGVLRAALYVMNKGFRKGDMGKGDPVKVARRIALMVRNIKRAPFGTVKSVLSKHRTSLSIKVDFK